MDFSHAIVKCELRARLTSAFSQIADFKFEIDYKPRWTYMDLIYVIARMCAADLLLFGFFSNFQFQI